MTIKRIKDELLLRLLCWVADQMKLKVYFENEYRDNEEIEISKIILKRNGNITLGTT